MSDLGGGLALSYLFLIIFVIYFVYDRLGWKFKRHPFRPFLLGVLLVLGATWLYQIEYKSKARSESILKSIEINVEQRNLFEQLAVASDLKVKILELIGFPFGVFLIVFALQSKTDREWEKRVELHAREVNLLSEFESQTALATENVILALDQKVPGVKLIELSKAVRNSQRNELRAKIDLRSRFPEFYDF